MLVFGDYRDDVFLIGIDLGDGDGYGTGAIYSIFEEASVASKTFEEFTVLYVNEDRRLSVNGAKAYQSRVSASEN